MDLSPQATLLTGDHHDHHSHHPAHHHSHHIPSHYDMMMTMTILKTRFRCHLVSAAVAGVAIYIIIIAIINIIIIIITMS